LFFFKVKHNINHISQVFVSPPTYQTRLCLFFFFFFLNLFFFRVKFHPTKPPGVDAFYSTSRTFYPAHHFPETKRDNSSNPITNNLPYPVQCSFAPRPKSKKVLIFSLLFSPRMGDRLRHLATTLPRGRKGVFTARVQASLTTFFLHDPPPPLAPPPPPNPAPPLTPSRNLHTKSPFFFSVHFYSCEIAVWPPIQISYYQVAPLFVGDIIIQDWLTSG